MDRPRNPLRDMPPSRRKLIEATVRRGEFVRRPEDAVPAVEFAVWLQRKARRRKSWRRRLIHALVLGLSLVSATVEFVRYGGEVNLNYPGVAFILAVSLLPAVTGLRLARAARRAREAERLNLQMVAAFGPA